MYLSQLAESMFETWKFYLLLFYTYLQMSYLLSIKQLLQQES